MLVKDHIAGETLTPEQAHLIVSCACDMCYMFQRALVVQCFHPLSLAILCITEAVQLVYIYICIQKYFIGLVQYLCTASTFNQIKINNRKCTQAFPLYKRCHLLVTSYEASIHRDVTLKIVSMCLFLAYGPGYARLNTVFCCPTIVPLFKFGVSDDPCI